MWTVVLWTIVYFLSNRFLMREFCLSASSDCSIRSLGRTSNPISASSLFMRVDGRIPRTLQRFRRVVIVGKRSLFSILMIAVRS